MNNIIKAIIFSILILIHNDESSGFQFATSFLGVASKAT